jgi:hypothetical protein
MLRSLIIGAIAAIIALAAGMRYGDGTRQGHARNRHRPGA